MHQATSVNHSGISLIRLSDVRLWADPRTNFVYDAHGNGIDELHLGQPMSDRERLEQTPVEHVPGTTALLQHLDPHNYYHWLIDTLPCAGVLDMAGIAPASLDAVYIQKFGSSFQPGMAALAGFDAARVLSLAGAPRHLHFDELLVPRFRLDGHGWPHPWMVQYLRDCLGARATEADVKTADVDHAEKVYIARGDARRRVVNEEELIRALRSLGYTILNAADTSFERQVGTLSAARFILGAHGAGLANMVFSAPGAKVMEYGGHYITTHFRMLSAYAGHEYRAIAAGLDETGQRSPISSAGERRSLDMRVDVNHVVERAEAFLKR